MTDEMKTGSTVGLEDEKAFEPKDKVDFEAREKFKSMLVSMVDGNVANIARNKDPKEQHMSYIDAKMLSAQISNFFLQKIGSTPPQIGVALNLSEAVLAPSTAERIQLIKAAVGIAGGVAGIGLVVNGIFLALGVGAGLIASIQAFFVGVAVSGPLGWILGGITLATLAGYFALMGSDERAKTEEYIKVLKVGLSSAVDAIWPEHGKALYAK